MNKYEIIKRLEELINTGNLISEGDRLDAQIEPFHGISLKWFSDIHLLMTEIFGTEKYKTRLEGMHPNYGSMGPSDSARLRNAFLKSIKENIEEGFIKINQEKMQDQLDIEIELKILKNQIKNQFKDTEATIYTFELVEPLFDKYNIICQELKSLYPNNFRDIQIPITPKIKEEISDITLVEKSELKSLLYKINFYLKVLEGTKKEKGEISSKLEDSTIYFYKLITEVKNDFRKIIIKGPNNEKDVQDYFEGYLKVKGHNFKREKESSSFSTGSFIPDFTDDEKEIALELKYIDEKKKVKVIIDEMSADIKPYSKRWNKILFLVYDKGGNISDTEEFTKDFIHKNENITHCIVIKH